MGKTYEKDGHLFEENDGPFPFGDKDLGELHENFDGSKETRNITGTNYRIEKEEPGFLEEVVGTVVPFATPRDRDASTSDGHTGNVHYDEWRKRYELTLDAKPKSETNKQDSPGHYRPYSGDESPTASSLSKRTHSFSTKAFGIGFFLLAVFIFISVLNYTPPPAVVPPQPPPRRLPVRSAHDPIYVYADSEGVTHYTNFDPGVPGARRIDIDAEKSPTRSDAHKKPEREVIVRLVDKNGAVQYINVPESELKKGQGTNSPRDGP